MEPKYFRKPRFVSHLINSPAVNLTIPGFVVVLLFSAKYVSGFETVLVEETGGLVRALPRNKT